MLEELKNLKNNGQNTDNYIKTKMLTYKKSINNFDILLKQLSPQAYAVFMGLNQDNLNIIKRTLLPKQILEHEE